MNVLIRPNPKHNVIQQPLKHYLIVFVSVINWKTKLDLKGLISFMEVSTIDSVDEAFHFHYHCLYLTFVSVCFYLSDIPLIQQRNFTWNEKVILLDSKFDSSGPYKDIFLKFNTTIWTLQMHSVAVLFIVFMLNIYLKVIFKSLVWKR